MNIYQAEFEGLGGGRQFGDYASRDRLVKKYAWAIPNQEALEAIAALGPIVEVGAGRGYWASLLDDMGVDIVAYDLNPPDIAKNHYCVPRDNDGEFNEYAVPFHPVAAADELVGANHPDRALLIIWPCYDLRWGHDAVRAYHEAGGTTVLFVGEGSGGCTADGAFFDYLYHYTDTDVEYIHLPQWSGIHDGLEVHLLRPADGSYVIRRYCSECSEMRPEAGFVVTEEGVTTQSYEWEGHAKKYERNFKHAICSTCYQIEWLPQHLLPADCP